MILCGKTCYIVFLGGGYFKLVNIGGYYRFKKYEKIIFWEVDCYVLIFFYLKCIVVKGIGIKIKNVIKSV